MADAEIQILLKVVDEMSGKLKTIEKEVSSFSNNVVKQTDNTRKSFESQIRTLLVLGNVASSVDNIFSSYTNLQLRLENATERVIGAQERLIEAQEKLNDVLFKTKEIALSQERLNLDEEKSKRKLKSLNNFLTMSIKNGLNPSSEKYKDIIESIQDEELRLKEIQFKRTELQRQQANNIVSSQRQVESATRGVTIAENNLERANNAVVGTYINMATQGLSVVASISTLTRGISGAGGLISGLGSLSSLIGVAGPVGVGVGVAGALFALVALMRDFTKDIEEREKKEVEELTKTFQNLGFSYIFAAQALAQLIEEEREIAKIQGRAGIGGTRTDLEPKRIVTEQNIIELERAKVARGGNVIVNIDQIYGMNPQQVSTALSKELNNRGVS